MSYIKNILKKHGGIAVYCLLLLLLSGCASAPSNPADPYESFNRASFRLNQKLDDWILHPIAKGYKKITPEFAQTGVHNFFSNLGEVPTIFNDFAQLNTYDAINDTWRLFINSTFGIVGFFDVASYMGLPKHQLDFGLTLAKWGYTQSSYLVLPLLGPGTVREAFAFPINTVTSVSFYIQEDKIKYGLHVFKLIDLRAKLLAYQNLYDQLALDPYIFMRDTYLQHREYQISTLQSGNELIADDDTKPPSKPLPSSSVAEDDYYVPE